MTKKILVAAMLTVLSYTFGIATIVVVSLVFGSGCASQTRTSDGRVAEVRHTPRRGPDMLEPETPSHQMPPVTRRESMCNMRLETYRSELQAYSAQLSVLWSQLDVCLTDSNPPDTIRPDLCTNRGPGTWTPDTEKCLCPSGFTNPRPSRRLPDGFARSFCVSVRERFLPPPAKEPSS